MARQTYNVVIRDEQWGNHRSEDDPHANKWIAVDEYAAASDEHFYGVRNPDGIIIVQALSFAAALDKVQRLRRTTQPQQR